MVAGLIAGRASLVDSADGKSGQKVDRSGGKKRKEKKRRERKKEESGGKERDREERKISKGRVFGF